MSDDSLLTIEKLIDGNRLAHGRSVAQEELIEVADALSSGELAQCEIALRARRSGLQQCACSTGCYTKEGEHRSVHIQDSGEGHSRTGSRMHSAPAVPSLEP